MTDPANTGAAHRADDPATPPAPDANGPDAAAAGRSHVPKTLADRLRMQISDDIVRGELAPGALLDEMELARRFHVSRTPVREAIRLLASSGLVDARPHRSAVVARPDRLQVLGMFEALCELEVLCAGFAAERMTRDEHAELQKIQRSLRPVVKSGDPQRYHEINEHFHAAVYAGSHNAYLARLTAETRARIAPFSRAQFRTLGRLAQSHAEHERVVAAILRGERDVAAAEMRAHIGYVHEAFAGYRPD
jgi:DNA-binding GntR family transcriptional regulator